MGKLDLVRQRVQSYNFLDRSFNIKQGVVKINEHNTLEHELAKFLLCWELKSLGKEFVTEAIFCNKKRADILVLDDCEAWEVVKSESDESIKRKETDYPVSVIFFNADKVIKSWKLLEPKQNILNDYIEVKEMVDKDFG